MPLKQAYENPVLAGAADKELFRACRSLTTQLNRERARSARNYSVWIPGVDAAVNVPLIARVSRSRFALGRMIWCFSADTTSSTTAYWTFSVVRYFRSKGARVSRPVATWGTDTVAPRAFDPYSVLVDVPLNPDDTLVLRITKTGSPSAISVNVTVEEVFRQED